MIVIEIFEICSFKRRNLNSVGLEGLMYVKCQIMVTLAFHPEIEVGGLGQHITVIVLYYIK